MTAGSANPLTYGPDSGERQAAVRYWKRAIQITADLGVDTMNSEFNGRPEAAAASEAQFWRSMEELLPRLRARGHPAGARAAPGRLHRGRPGGRRPHPRYRQGLGSSFLYCAPHTFHQGGNHVRHPRL